VRMTLEDLDKLEPDDYIVRLRYDGKESNERLTFNGNEMRFEWWNDWWEGEQDIEVLGWIKVDDVEVRK